MSAAPAAPHIAIVTTVDSSLHVMFPGLFERIAARGWRLTGICADGPYVERVRARGVRVLTVPMTRQFAVWGDAGALTRLTRLMRRERFDLIHYNTPKAALLAALAGRLAGRAALLYTIHGQGYGGYRGLARTLGLVAERVAARLADRVLCVSPSLADEIARDGIRARDRLTVLGAGSNSGVDLTVFARTPAVVGGAARLRAELGLTPDTVLIGYLGRLAREKGIERLVEAVAALRGEGRAVDLLLVGHVDQRNPLDPATVATLERTPGVHVRPFTDQVAPVLAALDVLALLSEREGFGSVLIEAGALGVPTVASDIPGCRDAVRDGETGRLVPPTDTARLTAVLRELVAAPELRARLGAAGAAWVRANFDRTAVWDRLLDVYAELLAVRRERR